MRTRACEHARATPAASGWPLQPATPCCSYCLLAGCVRGRERESCARARARELGGVHCCCLLPLSRGWADLPRAHPSSGATSGCAGSERRRSLVRRRTTHLCLPSCAALGGRQPGAHEWVDAPPPWPLLGIKKTLDGRASHSYSRNSPRSLTPPSPHFTAQLTQSPPGAARPSRARPTCEGLTESKWQMDCSRRSHHSSSGACDSLARVGRARCAMLSGAHTAQHA